jgi:dTDP-4-dehydrorhamnose reductase
MLASDVVRAAAHTNHEVLTITHEELDVCDAAAVEQAFVERYPHAIVNCAAWTDVDGAEDDPAGALAVNEQGARNVAAVAAELKVPVVYPSTDYVFDGSTTEPYIESDQPNPVSAYGRSKFAGELATAEVNSSHFIVRTSWLYGTGGRNFVETMLSLADELGEVLVVMDQIGCPTYTGHLAQAIITSAAAAPSARGTSSRSRSSAKREWTAA